MKINFKKLILCILIPLGLGALVGLIVPFDTYSSIVQPSFAPPAILFPIVWSILYILMGISYYLVSEEGMNHRIYWIQLVVNLLWSIWFFLAKMYLFSFIWILLLDFLVIIMIKVFYDIKKKAGLLQIPYLIWIIFASVLNLFVVILN